MNITLSLYIFRRFIVVMLGIFAIVAIIIFLADFVEALRRASDKDNFTFTGVFIMTLLHLPSLAEQTLPFAVLFGAMMGFFGLSRSLELVVARAAGISVWQFVAPAVAVCVLLGITAICIYNPLATYSKERYQILAGEYFESGVGTFGGRTGDIWLRQDGLDGQTILNAKALNPATSELRDVTVLVFTPEGRFQERIEAQSAVLRMGYWELTEALGVTLDAQPQRYSQFLVSTNLTQEQIEQSFQDAASVSFWQLPEFIEAAQRSGLQTTRFEYQYQSLLAKPLFLVAMAMVAASTSLGLFRYGGAGRMLITGVMAGFGLFLLSKIGQDLSQSDIISPMVAAWGPPLLALVLSVTRLLHTEDG